MAFRDLAAQVQSMHLPASRVRAAGVFQVEHAASRFARLAVRLLRLPPQTGQVAVQLEIRQSRNSETWRRHFGPHQMVTTQRAGAPGILVERIGWIELHFSLSVVNGALHYRQTAARLRLGPLSLPLPRWISPFVTATEAPGEAPDRIAVRVAVSLPLVGEVLRYSGWIAVGEQQG